MHIYLLTYLPTYLSSQVGAGEAALTAAFRRAKLSAPCVLFIDEFQAIFTSRSSSSSSSSSSGGGGGREDGPAGAGLGVGSTLSSTLAACFDDLQHWNSSAGRAALVTVIAVSACVRGCMGV